MRVGHLVLFAPILLLLAYCSAYPVLMQTREVRYDVSIDLETPQGPRHGSAVWGRRIVPRSPLYGPILEGHWNYSDITRGQAIVIPLSDGRTLFGLMGGSLKAQSGAPQPEDFNSGLPSGLPIDAFFRATGQTPDNSSPNFIRNQRMSGKQKADYEIAWLESRRGVAVPLDCAGDASLPRGDCLYLVTMDDIMRPATIRPVDDQSASGLGPGYRLSRMTVEVTDKPVTNTLLARLPWLHAIYGKQILDGCSDANDLQCNGFVRGLR